VDGNQGIGDRSAILTTAGVCVANGVGAIFNPIRLEVGPLADDKLAGAPSGAVVSIGTSGNYSSV